MENNTFINNVNAVIILMNYNTLFSILCQGDDIKKLCFLHFAATGTEPIKIISVWSPTKGGVVLFCEAKQREVPGGCPA